MELELFVRQYEEAARRLPALLDRWAELDQDMRMLAEDELALILANRDAAAEQSAELKDVAWCFGRLAVADLVFRMNAERLWRIAGVQLGSALSGLSALVDGAFSAESSASDEPDCLAA